MLKAIYKSGSSVFLDNYNDEDYIYYYETNEERKDALIKNHNHNVDNHYKLWENRLRITPFCYLYPFMEYVSGERIGDFETFNICDHKQEYKEIVKPIIEVAKNDNKIWYHILTACYMFENNKNELTSEQKQKVQETHDNGITQDLVFFCFKTIFTNN